MKLYRIEKNRDTRREREVISAEVSALKKASGGEDIVILSEEAMKSFRRGISDKNRNEELKKLALLHINDHNPELENPENDPEFMMAEKLVLLAELVIRVAVNDKDRNIYERVTDFVVEQLAGDIGRSR